MQKFKVAVSKWQKKYNIIIGADSENEARQKAHDEWYTILNVELFSEKDIKWQKFIFRAFLNNLEKKWVIIWDDIFKIYVKLRKDLKYDVKELYLESDKDKDDEYKRKIIKDLEQWYVNFENIGKDDKLDKNLENKKASNFYLKKSLEETYYIIDLIIKKLNYLIVESEDIDELQKEKIKNAYNNIIKLKKSTNISKLKQIWELALLKIWELELSIIEKKDTSESRAYLKETNDLLKKIWSKKQIIEKEKDLKYKFNKFLYDFKKSRLDRAKIKKQKEKIDIKSYSFLKTVLLLKKYKSRLNQNTLEILSSFWVFLFPFWKNLDKKDHLIIKRRVIKQNITILKAKKTWELSYAWIASIYNLLTDFLFFIFNRSLNFLFWVILIYSVLFIFYYTATQSWYILWEINYVWVGYYIFFILVFLVFSYSKGIFTLIFNFVIFVFFVIFWIVNF